MDGRKSKFDYADFCGDGVWFAVNKDKYTKEEAIELFKYEIEGTIGDKKGEYMLINGFAKWRAGITEDNEPIVGWWLEWKERNRGSCPVYCFERRWKDK